MSPPAAPLPSASELTPPADQVARFTDSTAALMGAPPSPDAPLGLAVSGGPDSVGMLLLAAAAFPGAVRAATVDHGLRAEAAQEAADVAALCARLGVPHATLPVCGEDGESGNLQDRARAMRYAALGRWARAGGVRAIAVAHQRDDVAESFLMRARRGSGVAGLAAMRAARPLDATGDVALLRPLLGWSREEVGAVASCLRVPVAQDASNRDPRFDRARMRALIGATPELVPSRLALSAQNLRHAEDALAWMEDALLPARFMPDEAGQGAEVDCHGLPYELRRRLVRRAIAHVRAAAGNGAPWHEQGLDRLVGALDSGKTATLAGVKAMPRGARWRFCAAPPHRAH